MWMTNSSLIPSRQILQCSKSAGKNAGMSQYKTHWWEHEHSSITRQLLGWSHLALSITTQQSFYQPTNLYPRMKGQMHCRAFWLLLLPDPNSTTGCVCMSRQCPTPSIEHKHPQWKKWTARHDFGNIPYVLFLWHCLCTWSPTCKIFLSLDNNLLSQALSY